jgi:hypothetical protein
LIRPGLRAAHRFKAGPFLRNRIESFIKLWEYIMPSSDFSQESLQELTSRWLSHEPGQRFKVYKDTTDFLRIDYGDIVIL